MTTEKIELDYGLTNHKLEKSLLKLKDEEFDILFIAEHINPEQAIILKKFRDEMYKRQKPFGIIVPVHLYSPKQITDINNIFKTGGIYKLITTRKRLKDESGLLSLIETAAWDTAYTAGLMVNKSETGKVIPNINGGETKKDTKELYELILKNGFHSQKIVNRRTGETITNNIKTPTGRDMSIERTKDYIIKDLSLKEIFGEANNNITHDYIKAMFGYKKKQYIDLNLINDMEYEIKKCDNNCVESNIELMIDDIISRINLNIKLT